MTGATPATAAPGVLQLFSLAFGVAIGIGWITVMGVWLGSAGPNGTMLAFLIAGAAMLAIGFSYAAVATIIPVRGGEYGYASRVFGKDAGFWVGWFLALAYIVVTAFEIISLAWICRELFPVLNRIDGGEGRPLDLGIGAIALVGVYLLNRTGGRAATRFQDGAVVVKTLLSILLIVVGIAFGDASNLEPRWGAHESGMPARGVMVVLAMAPFFYAGFGVAAQAIGDNVSPAVRARLWLVMATVIFCTMAFYALISLAAAYSAPRESIVAASLPSAHAFEQAFGSPIGSRLVLVLGLLGLLTILNGVYFASVKLLTAFGMSGRIPAILDPSGSERGFIAQSNLIVLGVVFGLALLGKDFLAPLLNVASFALSLVMGVVAAVHLKLLIDRGSRLVARIPPLIGLGMGLSMAAVPLVQATIDRRTPVPMEWVTIIAWVLLGIGFGLATARRRAPAAE